MRSGGRRLGVCASQCVHAMGGQLEIRACLEKAKKTKAAKMTVCGPILPYSLPHSVPDLVTT